MSIFFYAKKHKFCLYRERLCFVMLEMNFQSSNNKNQKRFQGLADSHYAILIYGTEMVSVYYSYVNNNWCESNYSPSQLINLAKNMNII